MGGRIGLGAMREAAQWVTGQEYNKLALPFIRGRWYFVCPGYGADTASGKTPLEALASIEEAYARCSDGVGDGIALLSYGKTVTTTTSYLSKALTWSKWGITVVGIAAPCRMSQRARISNAVAVTNIATLITVSGSNNAFYNFHIINEGLTGTGCFAVSGNRNYFENVHMVGGSAVTVASVADMDLSLTGNENTFVGCTFGTDTFDKGNLAGFEVNFPGTGAYCMRNRFYNCEFLAKRSAGTTAGMINCGAGNGINSDTLFDNCLFSMYRDGGVTEEVAVRIGTNPNNGSFLFKDCACKGFVDWAGINTGRDFSNMPVMSATGDGGKLIVCNPS